MNPTTLAGVHCPISIVSGPLDVDLCFEAEILDIKSGITYPADPVIIHALTKSSLGRNWIIPRDIRAFAKGREGFVTVKVILTPSRALALSDPMVRRYYPEKIVTGEMRMKVYLKVAPIP